MLVGGRTSSCYDVLCKSNLLDGLKTLAADPPVAFGGDSGCGEGSLQ